METSMCTKNELGMALVRTIGEIMVKQQWGNRDKDIVDY